MSSKLIHFIIYILLFLFATAQAKAQTQADAVVYDTVMSVQPFEHDAQTDSLLQQLETLMECKEILDSIQADQQARAKADSVVKKSILQKIISYIAGSSKPKDKPFDCTVLFGPTYSKSNNLTIGAGIAGQYSYKRSDPNLQKSNLSAFCSVNIEGCVMFYLKTNNYLPQDKYRWESELRITNAPKEFWGMGYDMGSDDANKHRYHLLSIHFNPSFLFRMGKYFFAGPQTNFLWMNVYRDYDEVLWQGQDYNLFEKGFGLNVCFDSRDVPTNAFKGYYVNIQNMVYPKFVNNDLHFNTADILLQGYWPVWRDCILAAQLHTKSIYGGQAPWFMMPQVGENNNMRGYYLGRYRDNNIIDGQIELRQHIWKQIGCTVFGGFANVFNRYKDLDMSQTLPNFGVGLRWEFKPRMNIRVDCGFTRHGVGFCIDMNEAF